MSGLSDQKREKKFTAQDAENNEPYLIRRYAVDGHGRGVPLARPPQSCPQLRNSSLISTTWHSTSCGGEHTKDFSHEPLHSLR
jgi:hypothetical protein